MSEKKTVSASRCIMTEMVLPNDTNNLGNMMGGRLMYLMDICAAISAQRHTNQVCVTAAVDSVEFESPIRHGEIVVIEGQVNRTFRTSLEIELNVWAEDAIARTRRKCNRAYFTFVAINEESRPVPVPPIVAETAMEVANYEEAARRRELRLVIAGRLPLKDARLVKEDILGTLMHQHRDE